MMKYYYVKVVERHVARIWVEAESRQEAKDIANDQARCEFDCTKECIILDEQDYPPEDN